MIEPIYIEAFRQFIEIEVGLYRKQSGEEVAQSVRAPLEAMYAYISANPHQFIHVSESDLNWLELEAVERVGPIKKKVMELADQHGIPREIMFIPSFRGELPKRTSIIHKDLAGLIRRVYAEDADEDLCLLRQFSAVDKKGPLCKWLKTKNGKNFLFERQVSEGLRKEALIRTQLWLFNANFEHIQMVYMSKRLWVHRLVAEAFEKWEQDHRLWSSIDHLKRQLRTREIQDESRLEIRFRRMLEESGYKGRFLHDENISWQLKFRPDFWFVEESLIVEYDEKAHGSKVEKDEFREKIIRKHLPNIRFIRVKEGEEEEGLKAIQAYLDRFDKS